MNRRDALSATAVFLGGVIIGGQAFLSGCKAEKTEMHWFTEADLAFLDEVGETILPATSKSPGAKAARIGSFMKTIVTDCYDSEEQRLFMEGIESLKKLSQQQYNRGFLQLNAKERNDLLTALDREATLYGKNKLATDPEHYFSMIKQLTIWGYFTSEPGATEALRFVPVPGRYEGCIDYKKGDPAWS
ncbi:MAG: gluconate 2-dehydrogenase subunit 3 family protein [Saprospiraceae bacterium]|nr:gluconate 2-dehydrogenase subunit 3 family protein [Saprospiraceae bacterium]